MPSLCALCRSRQPTVSHPQRGRKGSARCHTGEERENQIFLSKPCCLQQYLLKLQSPACPWPRIHHSKQQRPCPRWFSLQYQPLGTTRSADSCLQMNLVTACGQLRRGDSIRVLRRQQLTDMRLQRHVCGLSFQVLCPQQSRDKEVHGCYRTCRHQPGGGSLLDCCCH